MSKTIQIPKGWKEVTFVDISKDEKYSIKRGPWGSSITKSFFVPSGYKVYQQHNVIYDDFEYGTYFLDEKKFEELKEFEVKPGDFLISCSGTIGAIAIVPPNSKPGVMNQALLKISIDENKILPNYFKYFLKAPILQNKLLSKGSAMKNIASVPDLKKIIFTIPPIPTQKKIVRKLDDILGQLEEKKKEILELNQRIDYKKIIKTSRNHFLKLAFTGRLTETWRENNPNAKSGDMLLSEIMKIRKKLYKKQMEELKTKGLRKKKSKFLLEISPIPKYEYLPESWTVTTVNFLAFVTKLAGFEYTKYIKPKPSGEVPLIRAQNVQMGEFKKTNLKFISREISDNLERSQVNGNEILMVFIGDIGNVCLAPTDQRWHLAPNVAKIEVDMIDREYLYFYLQSPIGLKDALSRMKKSAQPSLSMETIRMVHVNLPSVEEQKEIVKLIKQNFTKISTFEKQINELSLKQKSTIKKINHIQSSILDAAFSGKLVQ